MAEESFEERTEAPSDRRRQEARERGSVLKSTEVNSVLVLLVGICLLRVLAPWMYRETVHVVHWSLSWISHPPSDLATFNVILRDSVVYTATICLPVVGGIMLAGILANVLQVGLLFTMQPLTPDFQKISPLRGAKRLFSMHSIVETLKSVAKLTVIGLVAYLSIKSEFGKFLMLADTSVGAIWVFTLETAFSIVLRIALVLIVIAILDYAYQRYEHEKNLKMTRQEVKEERKQMEGDPQVKARIKSLQREMARRRMMKEVPKATVVVTNPTHIAIAIRYEAEETAAPVVVAKGKRLVAERIKQIATDNGIPIVEDKPLARLMYDKVEVGLQIPMEFFTAVAEILAYVYRLKHKAAA